jgi:hypothetical protein
MARQQSWRQTRKGFISPAVGINLHHGRKLLYDDVIQRQDQTKLPVIGRKLLYDDVI